MATPALAAINPPSGSDAIQRIQGVDRFATAISASKAFDQERSANGGDTVFVANYLAWADIIAATPLAAEKSANVLYSYAGQLESRTKAELVRLAGTGVSNVVFVGGEGVLSSALVAEVEGLTGANNAPLNLTVDRIGGSDRYDTALQLAAETVESYSTGSGDLAAARQAIVQNEIDQNAVATAKAQAAAAATAYNKATSAYITALTNLGAAEAERTLLVNQLQTPLTSAEEEALKADIAAAQDAVIVAQQNLITAVESGDQVAIEAAQDALKVAQDDLAALQKELEDAAGAVANNAAIFTKIDAIDAKINGDKGLEAVAIAASDALATALNDVQAATGAVAAAPGVAAQAKEDAPALAKAYNDALSAALDDAENYPAFVATGSDFADALAAGPAAAQGFEGAQGVVLLTNGSTVPAATKRYLDAGGDVVAVGGAADAAVDADKSYVGADRYETAALLADEYQGAQLALASGSVAADAVIAGALLGNVGGAVVLTQAETLPAATKDFFSFNYTGNEVIVFGGTGAVSTSVANQVKAAIGG
ncbi:cell wall-binding repeat-containing protein [Microbacterium aerolatum]|uniref:Cell wall-binding repeat-containing protein n=1 Tax=Microbacterium profundi TaxID=450380 RepID=A0ABV3LK91_9MICO|nr:cell wall-binding repeat-containing protein [Microbacterium aerolatum]MCK3768535.1 cell wall-binding repeat-containing protein [Microbacterium aerolatum]